MSGDEAPTGHDPPEPIDLRGWYYLESEAGPTLYITFEISDPRYPPGSTSLLVINRRGWSVQVKGPGGGTLDTFTDG